MGKDYPAVEMGKAKIPRSRITLGMIGDRRGAGQPSKPVNREVKPLTDLFVADSFVNGVAGFLGRATRVKAIFDVFTSVVDPLARLLDWTLVFFAADQSDRNKQNTGGQGELAE